MYSLFPVSRSNLVAVGLVLASALAAVALSALLHVPHGPEHWSSDLRTAHLSKQNTSQHDKLALVYVTDKSLEPFPYSSPTDRGLLTRLIQTIDAAGAKVIGLDFIFDRATEPAKDDALATAIKNARAKVVLGSVGQVSPSASATSSHEADFQRRTGRPSGHLYLGEHHSPLVVSDNVVRTTYHSAHGEGQSFAEAVMQAAGMPAKPASHYISWLRPPSDGAETFLTLSTESILARPGSAGALPLDQLLKDRIVLVGGNFFDRDQHLTPFSVATGQRYPGLSVHAQIIAQMLDGRALELPGPFWQFLLALASAAFGYWTGLRSGKLHLFAELATVAGLILLGILAFRYFDMILPYTVMLLSWLAGAAGGHYGRSGQH